MASVSSVIKFSPTQEARPPLIQRFRRRVSAREMKRSASATVGARLAAFGVAAGLTAAGVCARALGVNKIAAASSSLSKRLNVEFAMDIFVVTFSSLCLVQ